MMKGNQYLLPYFEQLCQLKVSNLQKSIIDIDDPRITLTFRQVQEKLELKKFQLKYFNLLYSNQLKESKENKENDSEKRQNTLFSFEKKLKTLKNVILKNPNYSIFLPQIHFLQAKLSTLKQKNQDLSIEKFEKCLESLMFNPESKSYSQKLKINSYTELGTIYKNQKKYQKAIENFKWALSFSTQYNLQCKTLQKSSKWLKKIVILNQKLGEVYFEMQDHPTALQYYNQSLTFLSQLIQLKGQGYQKTNLFKKKIDILKLKG